MGLARHQSSKEHSLREGVEMASRLTLAPPLASRPWYWPFEASRLVTSHSLRAALIFLGVAAILRALVAATLGLSDDEAWYWALSGKNQLSFIVHPPLSMWLVKLSTALLGPTPFAVRFPSLVCATLGSFWLVRLTARLGWAKGAEVTALLAMVTPLLFMGGILAGPDLPLFVFWAAAMETSFELGTNQNRSLLTWAKLGACFGFAALSKLTGLLAIMAALMWFVSSRPTRSALRGAGPWTALAVALALFSPVLIWNANHDWAALRFQAWDRHGGSEMSLKRWAIFWVAQLVLMGPALVYGWFKLMKRCWLEEHGSENEKLNMRFLAAWALAPAAIFFIQPLFSPFKIHWALLAYLPVTIYFAKLAMNAQNKALLRRAISTASFVTAFAMACFYLPVFPALTATAGAKKNESLHPAADVTSDFNAWKGLGEHIDGTSIASKDLPLVTNRYQIAAQAAFALAPTPPGRSVLLIPQNSHETRDWGGTTDLPARFIFVTDNRFNDTQAHKDRTCSPLPDLVSRRGSYISRRIHLSLCEENGAAGPSH